MIKQGKFNETNLSNLISDNPADQLNFLDPRSGDEDPRLAYSFARSRFVPLMIRHIK